MSLDKPLFQVRFFQGINNLAPAQKIIPRAGKSFLAAGSNIDIDDAGTFEAALRCLTGYLLDPGGLKARVIYR